MMGKTGTAVKEKVKTLDFQIRLAGKTIGVRSLYDRVFELCRDYRIEGEADLQITVVPDDIASERAKAKREAAAEGKPNTDYSDAYLETLAVYRKIADAMPGWDAWLMHGSAVCVDGITYLFTAPSGTGKTTHSRFWLEQIPGAYVLNGDKPLLRRRSGIFEVCGTPWSGKEGWNRNAIVPLRAICQLERGEENRIEETDLRTIYPLLLQQSYRPEEPDALRKTMELISAMENRVRFYRLSCNLDPEAARIAWKGMQP